MKAMRLMRQIHFQQRQGRVPLLVLGPRRGARRGFVLLLAIGVVAVLFLLGMAALVSAQQARSATRVQRMRDGGMAIRSTLETLARSSADGLASTGSVELGRWNVSWKALPQKGSIYADVATPEGGAVQVVVMTGRRSGAGDSPPDLREQILLMRGAGLAWTVAAWKSEAPPTAPPKAEATNTP